MYQPDIFLKASTLFEDSEDNEYFVGLNHTRIAYSKLTNSLNNPFKIILVYGPPGSGKSFLFNRFYNQYSKQNPIFYIKTPTFDELETLKDIYFQITNIKIDEVVSKYTIIDLFRKNIKKPILILLDEAQMYSSEKMEWIRLLSNEIFFKFIICVHKLDKEDLLAQQHFKTRTYETIELHPITKDEIKLYIETKLIQGEVGYLYQMFYWRNFSLIYKITKGNLRDLNRLIGKMFNFYYQLSLTNPSKIERKITNKHIEMIALDLKII